MVQIGCQLNPGFAFGVIGTLRPEDAKRLVGLAQLAASLCKKSKDSKSHIVNEFDISS
jgi:hypothetical protein